MIEAISDGIYFAMVLAVPTLIGVCIGRGIKPVYSPADEALGRKVRQAVEDVRFRARFVNADFDVIYTGDLTVPADRATYSIAITRKVAA